VPAFTGTYLQCVHAARRAASAVHAVYIHTVATHVAGARMLADLCAVGCKANRLVTLSLECTCDGQYGSFALYQRGNTNRRVGHLYLAVRVFKYFALGINMVKLCIPCRNLPTKIRTDILS